MALGTREQSRYCAPADEATGCNQCELTAQEQCKQTFYLKQQNEILQEKSRVETDTVAPTSATTSDSMTATHTQEITLETQNDLDAAVLTSTFFIGGLVLGFVISIVFLKIAKRI